MYVCGNFWTQKIIPQIHITWYIDNLGHPFNLDNLYIRTQSSKNAEVISVESMCYIRTNHSQNINLTGQVINCVKTMQCVSLHSFLLLILFESVSVSSNWLLALVSLSKYDQLVIHDTLGFILSYFC